MGCTLLCEFDKKKYSSTLFDFFSQPILEQEQGIWILLVTDHPENGFKARCTVLQGNLLQIEK